MAKPKINYHAGLIYSQKERPSGLQNLILDLWVPENQSKRTLVLFLHGGDFFKGVRTDRPSQRLAGLFTARGFSFGRVSYRLAGTIFEMDPQERPFLRPGIKRFQELGAGLQPKYYGPAFANAAEDVGEAMNFCKSQAQEFGLLADRIVLVGFGAGAIAAAEAAYPRVAKTVLPDAVLGVGGAIVRPWQLHADGPPMLFLQGTQDRFFRQTIVNLMTKWAKDLNADVRVRLLYETGHANLWERFFTLKGTGGKTLLAEALDFLSGTKG